ncbi:hypothetical protein FRC17_001570 [Serendipita sp. 399]|nr:hypothetical protein FRC17_001570 [Serendipita sp. 399]
MSQNAPKNAQITLSVRVEDEAGASERRSVPFSAHTSRLLSPNRTVNSPLSPGQGSEDKSGSPLSPSDDSSRPSLDEDSESDDSSSCMEEEDEPSLQTMGEDHVRKQKVKDSQTSLGLAFPSSLPRPRVISDSLAYEANSSSSSNLDPSQNSAEPSNSPPEAVALSPAMQFLAGLNSPFSAARRSVTSPAPSKPAEERIGPYVLGAVIGHGGFSVIRKGTSASGVVAVKIISKTSSQRRSPSVDASLESEIAVWSSLHHEYVLPLFTNYRTDDAIYLVTLYCPAGSLFHILRLHGSPGLPHDDVGTMFRQIIRGLRYLHEQARIVHGDIKLENILVDEMGACRIADFGLARRISEEPTTGAQDDETSAAHPALPPHLRGRQTRHRNSTHVPGNSTPSSLHHFPPGSLPYASPELLLPPSRTPGSSQEIVHRPYPANPAQDIWAVGCLLHALLFGRLPFVDSYEPRLQMKIVRGVWERSRSKTRSRVRGTSRSRSRLRSSSRDQRRFQHQVGSRDISKSRSEDVKIGKGARTVLRGCICVEVSKRWSAAQIDEVAWNVGWEDPQTIIETEIVGETGAESAEGGGVTVVTNAPLADGGLKGSDHHLDAGWLTDEGGDKLTPISSRARATSRDGSRVKHTGRRYETLP